MAVKTVPIVLLGLVLAFPSLSVQGASEGLLLWYQTVLPALAPFLILTQLLTVSGGAELLVKPVYPLFHRLFHVSVSGAYILLCGLLCGYPLGAKLCSDYFRQGKISQKEAQYLLPSQPHVPSWLRQTAASCQHPSPVPSAFRLPSDSSSVPSGTKAVSARVRQPEPVLPCLPGNSLCQPGIHSFILCRNHGPHRRMYDDVFHLRPVDPSDFCSPRTSPGPYYRRSGNDHRNPPDFHCISRIYRHSSRPGRCCLWGNLRNLPDKKCPF